MILRVERIDEVGSMTFNVSKPLKKFGLIFFGDMCYEVCNIVEFTNHTLALVKQVNVLKLSPSQILISEVNDE